MEDDLSLTYDMSIPLPLRHPSAHHPAAAAVELVCPCNRACVEDRVSVFLTRRLFRRLPSFPRRTVEAEEEEEAAAGAPAPRSDPVKISGVKNCVPFLGMGHMGPRHEVEGVARDDKFPILPSFLPPSEAFRNSWLDRLPPVDSDCIA